MKKSIFVILFLIIPAFLFSEDPPPTVNLSLGAILVDSTGLSISVAPEPGAPDLDLSAAVTGEDGDELLLGIITETGQNQKQWEVFVRTANGFRLRGNSSWNDVVIPYELRIQWYQEMQGGRDPEQGDTGYFSQNATVTKTATPLNELNRTLKIRYDAAELMLPADTYQDTIIFTISNL